MPLNDDERRKWRGRIELAKRYQKEFGNIGDRWDKFVKALAGDFNSKNLLGDEAIDVNITRSDVKTRLSPLWLQDPFVTFTPTRDRVKIGKGDRDIDNVRHAEFSEVEVNYWLTELKVRTEVTKPCVLDAETTNHGYAYLGYTTEKLDIEQDGEEVNPNPLVKFKKPFIVRKSPREVLFPPGSDKLEHCEWVCLTFRRPILDLEARYGLEEGTLVETSALESVLPGEVESATETMKEFLESDDAKVAQLQIVWDKRTKKVYHFIDGHDEEVEIENWELETEGFPLVDLVFEDIPDEHYGTPPMQFSYPQQIELNASRTSMRKRYNRSKAVKFVSGEVSDPVKDAYALAKDGALISVDLELDKPLSSMFHDDPGLQQDPGVHVYEEKIQNDFRQITGTSAEQRGAGDPNVDSATASANIQQNVQIRGSERGDRVAEFYETMARKLWMILKQQPNVKRTMRIAGDLAGVFSDLEYTLDDLEGEYAIKIDIGTVLPVDPASRLTLALTNYNLFRQDPLVSPESLILDVYKAQNEVSPEKKLLTLRTPDEELQLVAQGLPIEPHERDDHIKHQETHELQMSQIEAQLQRVDPESNMGQKLRLMLAGMLMHMNAHMKMLMAISGQGGGKPPGSPVTENLLRNQQSQLSGSETSAELGGQALIGPTGRSI